jgi:hypothetical protein
MFVKIGAELRHPDTWDLIGKTVRVRRGPAAVNGDESRDSHCFAEARWEGMVSRMIRKPEDLPESSEFPRTVNWEFAIGGRVI